ncbi:MAG TPA: hypothetical protein VLA02_08075 [Reyranella sp.]|nr:hypothetical protein [Reyranella sp.]
MTAAVAANGGLDLLIENQRTKQRFADHYEKVDDKLQNGDGSLLGRCR